MSLTIADFETLDELTQGESWRPHCSCEKMSRDIVSVMAKYEQRVEKIPGSSGASCLPKNHLGSYLNRPSLLKTYVSP